MRFICWHRGETSGRRRTGDITPSKKIAAEGAGSTIARTEALLPPSLPSAPEFPSLFPSFFSIPSRFACPIDNHTFTLTTYSRVLRAYYCSYEKHHDLARRAWLSSRLYKNNSLFPPWQRLRKRPAPSSRFRCLSPELRVSRFTLVDRDEFTRSFLGFLLCDIDHRASSSRIRLCRRVARPCDLDCRGREFWDATNVRTRKYICLISRSMDRECWHALRRKYWRMFVSKMRLAVRMALWRSVRRSPNLLQLNEVVLRSFCVSGCWRL